MSEKINIEIPTLPFSENNDDTSMTRKLRMVLEYLNIEIIGPHLYGWQSICVYYGVHGKNLLYKVFGVT